MTANRIEWGLHRYTKKGMVESLRVFQSERTAMTHYWRWNDVSEPRGIKVTLSFREVGWWQPVYDTDDNGVVYLVMADEEFDELLQADREWVVRYRREGERSTFNARHFDTFTYADNFIRDVLLEPKGYKLRRDNPGGKGMIRVQEFAPLTEVRLECRLRGPWQRVY